MPKVTAAKAGVALTGRPGGVILGASREGGFFVELMRKPKADLSDLSISFETRELSVDDTVKLYQGVAKKIDDMINVSLSYSSGGNLSMRLPTEQKDIPAGTTPADIKAAKHRAALEMVLMAFANAPKDSPIVISGNDRDLVALAKQVAEKINANLSPGNKREVKFKDAAFKLTPEEEAAAQSNFAATTKGFEIERNGNKFDFDPGGANKWDEFVSKMNKAEMDATMQSYKASGGTTP